MSPARKSRPQTSQDIAEDFIGPVPHDIDAGTGARPKQNTISSGVAVQPTGSSTGFAQYRKAAPPLPKQVRHLCIVLGDQLDRNSALLDDFDPTRDLLWMAEVLEESRHVPSHKQRTICFLAAMRHYAVEQWQAGRPLQYEVLDDPANTQSLASELARAVKEHHPQSIRVVLPGDFRVLHALQAECASLGLALEVLPDRHFTVTPHEYAKYLGNKRSTRMEFFYRWQRQRLNVLMEDGKPVLDRWNFDAENREAVRDPEHRASIPQRVHFPPDSITGEVIQLVNELLMDNPGQTESFGWPVTPEQARAALAAFIDQRLALFGRYQDAMVMGEAWMWHSHISVALNLKLITPMECVRRAEEAWREGRAPIESVEGFIRQIIGWREYIRCVYYQEGPNYGNCNELGMDGNLPDFYWTGNTPMRCMRECISQTLEHGYAHHIQRLMVTGNFALIAGVSPRAISDWYLAIYVDAVDWVTLPNTLGMVMHADGGVVGSKPYAASGRYIERQSDYCRGCEFKPGERVGPKACPFTTLYWDFLLRYRERFERNPRMATIIKNLDRFGNDTCTQIRQQAEKLRRDFGVTPATEE